MITYDERLRINWPEWAGKPQRFKVMIDGEVKTAQLGSNACWVCLTDDNGEFWQHGLTMAEIEVCREIKNCVWGNVPLPEWVERLRPTQEEELK